MSSGAQLGVAQARFWILRQKYVEALQAEDVQLALATLRQELAPLQVNTPEVRALAGAPSEPACCACGPGSALLDPCGPAAAVDAWPPGSASVPGQNMAASATPQVFPSALSAGLLLQPPGDKAQAGADWAPAQAATRPMLVDSLQRLLPPTLMVPDGRLEQLLEQALDAQASPAQTLPLHVTLLQRAAGWHSAGRPRAAGDLPCESRLRCLPAAAHDAVYCVQIQACPYYNVPPTSLSLLSNYQAGMEQLPTQPAQVGGTLRSARQLRHRRACTSSCRLLPGLACLHQRDRQCARARL